MPGGLHRRADEPLQLNQGPLEGVSGLEDRALRVGGVLRTRLEREVIRALHPQAVPLLLQSELLVREIHPSLPELDRPELVRQLNEEATDALFNG